MALVDVNNDVSVECHFFLHSDQLRAFVLLSGTVSVDSVQLFSTPSTERAARKLAWCFSLLDIHVPLRLDTPSGIREYTAIKGNVYELSEGWQQVRSPHWHELVFFQCLAFYCWVEELVTCSKTEHCTLHWTFQLKCKLFRGWICWFRGCLCLWCRSIAAFIR